MDKFKLIQIVLKDLDELKLLSEEVAEFETDSSLIVDLALSKARLLCQEIELLHEYIEPPIVAAPEEDEYQEDENSDLSVADPELEIANFNEDDVPEDLEDETPEEESDEIKIDEEEEEEFVSDDDDDEEIEDEPSEEFDEVEVQEPEPAEIELDEEELSDESEEIAEEDQDSDEIEETEDDVVYNSDEDEEEEPEEDDLEEELEEEEKVQLNHLNDDSPVEVREIYIDDLDDDEIESFKITPTAETSARPVMREIPKPEEPKITEPVKVEPKITEPAKVEPLTEEPVKDKQLIGEKFHKERSLNDAIGESKSTESKVSNGPISSLRAAIGLNDRFLFIREIFDNNTEKYNTIIDQLDKLKTIQEAVDYLKVNLSLQKNETSLKFVDLLKRRFSK